MDGVIPRGNTDAYALAQEKLNALSAASGIIGEELENFFFTVRKRLNEVSLNIPIDEVSKTICNLVALRFGVPTARKVIRRKRARNRWNEYEKGNYKRLKCAMGIPTFTTSLTIKGILLLKRRSG
jgi:hypothetical protein